MFELPGEQTSFDDEKKNQFLSRAALIDMDSDSNSDSVNDQALNVGWTQTQIQTDEMGSCGKVWSQGVRDEVDVKLDDDEFVAGEEKIFLIIEKMLIIVFKLEKMFIIEKMLIIEFKLQKRC